MRVRQFWKPHPQWYFSLFLVAVFAWWIIEARGWPIKTQFFPLVIAIPMLGLAIFQLARDILDGSQKEKTSNPSSDGITNAAARVETSDSALDGEDNVTEVPDLSEASARDLAKISAELLSYFVGVYLLGFVEVIPVFAALYLRFEAKEPWWRAILIGVAIWAFVWGLFVQVLHLPFPSGIVTSAIDSLF